jgi:hypothetical protein
MIEIEARPEPGDGGKPPVEKGGDTTSERFDPWVAVDLESQHPDCRLSQHCLATTPNLLGSRSSYEVRPMAAT